VPAQLGLPLGLKDEAVAEPTLRLLAPTRGGCSTWLQGWRFAPAQSLDFVTSEQLSGLRGVSGRIAWWHGRCARRPKPVGWEVTDGLLDVFGCVRRARTDRLTVMGREAIAVGQRQRAPFESSPARSMACAGAWDDSRGAVGVITEGFSTDSATQHLFAALSTRQAAHDVHEASVACRNGFGAVTPAIAAALDRLNVAVCAFDADDRTAFWNDAYLRFFPEQVGFIHQGEPYRANLRRFYKVRLEPEELGLLERYVDEGVARPSDEQAPQAFSHRGFWLQAAEEAGPAGRICLWTRATNVVPVAVKDEVVGPGMVGLASGLDLFEHVGEGIMLTGPEGRIGWVNEAFVAMYRLPDKARAAQGDFVDVYLTAWRGADPSERARFESGLALLEENLCFAGAPYELPLPGDRWVRVVEQRRPDGFACFAHVDISLLKRRQQRLLRAEERVRAFAAQLAEKSALLDAMLDRIDTGVVMVGGLRSVEGCNRRPALEDVCTLHPPRHVEGEPFSDAR
jgi:PAS domain-containing protein